MRPFENAWSARDERKRRGERGNREAGGDGRDSHVVGLQAGRNALSTASEAHRII